MSFFLSMARSALPAFVLMFCLPLMLAPIARAQAGTGKPYVLSRTIDLGGKVPKAAAFVPETSNIVVVEQAQSSKGTIMLFDYSTGSLVRSMNIPLQGMLATTDLHPEGIPKKAQPFRRMRPASLSAFSVHPTGQTLLLGSNSLVNKETLSQGHLSIIDLASGASVRSFPVRRHRHLAAAAFSPDGSKVAAIIMNSETNYGAAEGTLFVWEASTGREVFKVGSNGTTAVQFSPDGQSILTAGTHLCCVAFETDTATLELWDANTGKRISEIKRTGGYGFSLAKFSPDGRFIATSSSIGSEDAGRVNIWDVSTMQEALPLRGRTGHTFGMDFSPDGSRLITAANGFDQMNIWDLKTGAFVTSLQRKEGAKYVSTTFTFIAFHPQDNNFITAGGDGKLRLWEDAAKQRQVFSAELAAAQAGDAAAMARVQVLYREGRGTPKDVQQADDWLSRAAAAGDLSARTQLASILMSGDGSRQDCQAAGRELRAVLAAKPGGDAAAVMDTILAPLGGASATSGLSPQIQADLLETQAIEALRQKDYPAFLQNLCALEALDHIERLLPEERNELLFHRAAGLRAAGKPVAALSALNEYLNTAGSTGPSYTEALQLLRPLQDEAK